MTHALGVYWAPGHQRPTDIEYMQRLQPPAIRVLDPDPNQLAIAHKAAPRALSLPRDWALSEQHDDVRRDPVGTGKRHANEWRQKLDRWDRDYEDMPPDEQIIVVGINEPRVWDMLPQVVEYTVAWLDECTRLGLRACALNLSVGWPANKGGDTPPDWTPYAPIEAAIKRGNHFLVLHEYWYRTGPRDGWGWFAGRLQHCPWDVPIIVGECGIDMYVDMQRWQNDGKPNRGWRGNVSPDTYAAQMQDYVSRLDKRVVAVLPFLTDYRSNNWESFDTAEAHPHLLARKDDMQPQAGRLATEAPPPAPVEPPKEPSMPTDDNEHRLEAEDKRENWERSRAFIKRWEGGYQNVANDAGNWTGGAVGVGENKGTNFGISAASYPHLDIRNLTIQQADEIYYRDYWAASGAAALRWPLCLLVLDTAVLHGVGTAKTWLKEVGLNPYAFAAKRLRVYTKMSNWDYWGKGQTNRTADLLEEMGK